MAAQRVRQEVVLRRTLGLHAAVALGIGGTVGGGVYVLVGAAAAEAGPAALAAFALAFLASLLIALPYAELACRHPMVGGGYAFAHAVLGRRVGFLMGWGFWGAYLFISGYVTLGFGGYLHALTGVPAVVGALGVVAVCLVLNLVGVRIAGAAQTVVVAVAIAGLLAFGAWGLPSVEPANLDPLMPMGSEGVLSAALLAFLAFGGFDMVAAAGEEIERPERNLPRAILITLGAVLGLYLLVCLVAVGVMSSAALGSSAAPLADAAERFGGASARALVMVTALLTTAATANAVLVVTSRICFAMARDRLLPAALSRVSGPTGAPWAALLLCASLLAVVATAGSVSFAASVGGFLYVLHFVVPLIALVVLRGSGDRAPAAFRTPAPRVVLPLAFAGCALLLVAGGAGGPPAASAGSPSAPSATASHPGAPWFNETLATVNDAVVRLGVVEGEFHWHKHDDQDEFFLVLEGELQIDLQGERTITLGRHQAFTVPRAVVHRTRAAHRTAILMVEAAGVVATGD